MEKAIKHLKEMETWMDLVHVSAENIDYMAMARQEYRNAMTELQRIQTEGKKAANG